MDGNGRWATRRGLPRLAGHRAGVAAVRRVVERADELGVRCLTLYAFSSDNWRRPMLEVQGVFWLLRAYLRLERERLRARSARLEIIGRRDRLSAAVLKEVEAAERFTANGTGLHLRVAIDYSSRYAITRAALRRLLLASTRVAGRAEFLERQLEEDLTGGSGNVDLLIRTGGEQRLSDFLLWECAYAELLFTDRMWPDFNGDDLDRAIEEFAQRQRRFGGVPDTPSQEPALAGGAG
jgi:undecaprenyl diphosphate synthase